MNMPVTDDLDAPGTDDLIGRWRILKCVGEGASGIVYRCVLADDPGAGEFALKLAKSPEDPRFEREGEMLSRIDHPNVPPLREQGVWVGPQGRRYPYLVMGWAEGQRLYEGARTGGLTHRQVFRTLAQVARALAATHEHGFHRDVKGNNVLVSPKGHVMLVDFGACWYADAMPLTDNVIPPGTEVYRSHQILRFRRQFREHPEAQYSYRPEDDVYALGVTAYRLVTGIYPPQGTDPDCEEETDWPRPPPPRPPSQLATVRPELEAFILQMLSADPAARGTARGLAEALDQAEANMEPEEDTPIQRLTSRETAHRTSEAAEADEADEADEAEPSSESTGSRRHRRVPDWIAWSISAITGAFLVLIVGRFMHCGSSPVEAPPQVVAAGELEEEEPPEVEKEEDHPTAGLADGGVPDEVALASAENIPRAGVSPMWIGAEMPKEPFPGQRRPPCPPRQIEARGGCWHLGTGSPPCDNDYYEWGGRCVSPAMPHGRVPTSDPQ